MKKQLLFLITLLMAISPACKQKNKPNLAGPNGAIAAGSILTAGGIATTTASGILISGAGLASLGTIVGIASVIPGVLFIIGIPLIIYGAKKRKAKIKKFNDRQRLEMERMAVQENSNAEEIQTIRS